MIRIYFGDEDSAKTTIFNGVTILGRRYRVEPPRLGARHLPRRRCAQYGNSNADCKNQAICFKCGNHPGKCTHPPTANIMYCATCRNNDHYTGQIRFRLYPRSSPPPETQRPMPLIHQNVVSPPRPSTTNFPALNQCVWNKNPITNKQTKPTNNRRNKYKRRVSH